MNSLLSQYKYSYVNSDPMHHHSYLFASLLGMLSRFENYNQKKLRILDLGCGNGNLTNLIAQQGYKVTGIEQSESGIHFARQNFPNCHFIQGSIYDSVPEELEKSFDIVISAEVIEHLYYPRELVKYARQCIKLGGHLIVTTPYHGYWKNLALSLTGKMDRHFTTLWDGGHVKFFSVKTLSSILQSEGFTDLKFDFAGRIPYFWKSMLCSCSLNNEKE
ncbi:MAG: methyltransferase domain-containing protein [Xenococcaceae cyanobacterium MO_188.B29]|nr:methyltransferase domain-containing protein [Xenococcaceae cyanobacterium MO_188.B29]